MKSQNATGGPESTESTGLLDGGVVTINANPALFDISDGDGFVVDNYTDPENPVKTKVTWTGLTGITVPNLATQDLTVVGINSAGSVVQQATVFTEPQKRDIIFLAVLFHTDNVLISDIIHSPNTRFDFSLQLSDFIRAIGAVNTSGNVFSANGINLSVDRTAGTIFRLGSNYAVDKKSPSTRSLPSASAQAFHRQYQDGVGGYITEDAVTVVDVAQYDNGSGTLAAVPANLAWQVKRIWVINESIVIMAYSQDVFATITTAEASITSQTYNDSPQTSALGVLRGWLIVSRDTTDLSDSKQAKFITANSIAGGSSQQPSGGGTVDPTASQLNTSLNNGGILAVNANTTLFDISDGNGWVVDNYTDPDFPVTTKVSWAGLTGIAPTTIATDLVSFISINNVGTVIQTAERPSSSDLRDLIFLGTVGHVDNVNVTSVQNFPYTRFDMNLQILSFLQVVGTVNKSGNVYTANGVNLTIDKSSGEIFKIGINYAADKKDPSTIAQTAATPSSFRYVYQDGIGGYVTGAVVTDINPGDWDDGTGTLNPVANNEWTVQRVYMFSSGGTVIMYDQAVYTSSTTALASINANTFVPSPLLVDEGLLRGFIVVKGNAIDLSNAAQATFLEANAFGSGVAGGGTSSSTDLQDAYNNSIASGEIVVDALQGAVTVKDALTPIGANLLEVLSNDGATPYFEVDVNGIKELNRRVALNQIDVACNSNVTFTQISDNSQYFKMTFTSSCTLAFTFPATEVTSIALQMINAGTYTVTWPAGIQWVGGTEPTLTAAGTDVIIIWQNGDNVVFGTVAGQEFS